MPADVLRDRETDTPPASGFADIAQAAAPDLSTRIQSNEREMGIAREKQTRAREDERAAMETRAAALKPQIASVEQAMGQREQLAANRPPPLALPPPPSRKLTDFLAPVEGEQPENTISKLLQGVGLLASGFTGLRRGNASTALASMAGALKGWHEGDKERADREFGKWQAEMDKLIQENRSLHKSYEDIMQDADTSVDQKMQLLRLKAVEAGHEVALKTFDRQNYDEDVRALTDYRKELNALQHQSEVLGQQYKLRQTQFAIAEMGRETAREHWLADYQQRERLANQRVKEGQSEKPLPGEWFDRKSGERAYPTHADYREPDFEKRFHKSNQQGVTRVEQIRIALPMIDRLRQLTGKILADQPVQNLVKALELEGQNKTASNPDLREWQALVKDTNVKMTAVMGPGQFRVTLLHVLQGAGLKTTDTKATAGRLLDQWETNIENDLAAITGQPLRAHLSGPWRGYAQSPDGARKVIELGAGERIDPGWKPLEEVK